MNSVRLRPTVFVIVMLTVWNTKGYNYFFRHSLRKGARKHFELLKTLEPPAAFPFVSSLEHCPWNLVCPHSLFQWSSFSGLMSVIPLYLYHTCILPQHFTRAFLFLLHFFAFNCDRLKE